MRSINLVHSPVLMFSIQAVIKSKGRQTLAKNARTTFLMKTNDSTYSILASKAFKVFGNLDYETIKVLIL